ncbi:elongation factor Tu GTP binding domain protein [Mycobacterium kansasii]|uniref:Elongation factor Tu GTP binding domain protein n=1 Tax=Mycobacterium kansasii TaxID=1768 RepID=A0A1V3XKP8_MYCKA|nr:elongation factor Tu GTP binding domain protein [Mycobacterium kansasii]
MCIPADEAIGPGDRWILEQIRSVAPGATPQKLVVIVTKIDKLPKERVAAQLVAVGELMENLPGSTEIVPVSAVTGAQVDVLVDVLAGRCHPARRTTPTAS